MSNAAQNEAGRGRKNKLPSFSVLKFSMQNQGLWKNKVTKSKKATNSQWGNGWTQHARKWLNRKMGEREREQESKHSNMQVRGLCSGMVNGGVGWGEQKQTHFTQITSLCYILKLCVHKNIINGERLNGLRDVFFEVEVVWFGMQTCLISTT